MGTVTAIGDFYDPERPKNATISTVTVNASSTIGSGMFTNTPFIYADDWETAVALAVAVAKTKGKATVRKFGPQWAVSWSEQTYVPYSPPTPTWPTYPYVTYTTGTGTSA